MATEMKKISSKQIFIASMLLIAAIFGVSYVLSMKFESVNSTMNGSAISPTPEDPTEITSKKWTWVNTQMNDGTNITPSTEGAFTLNFGTDLTVQAGTDCNNGNGSYSLGENNSLTFGPMATTQMFCEASNETRFYQDINNVGSYMIKDGQLVLMLKFDSGSMIFE